MIRNFKRRVFESLDNRVPKSEQDLLDIMNKVQPSYVDNFRKVLNDTPLPFDYGSLDFKVIGQFIYDYFYNKMKSIKIGSWKLHESMFDDSWIFFEYRNKESEDMYARICFSWSWLSVTLWAEVNDVDFDIPEAHNGSIEGFSINSLSLRRFPSQSAFLIAFCDEIANADSKVLSFVKKVLTSITKEPRVRDFENDVLENVVESLANKVDEVLKKNHIKCRDNNFDWEGDYSDITTLAHQYSVNNDTYLVIGYTVTKRENIKVNYVHLETSEMFYSIDDIISKGELLSVPAKSIIRENGDINTSNLNNCARKIVNGIMDKIDVSIPDYEKYQNSDSRKREAKKLWKNLSKTYGGDENLKNMIDLWCDNTDITDIADNIGYSDDESRYDVGENFLANDDYVYKLSVIGESGIDWVAEELID